MPQWRRTTRSLTAWSRSPAEETDVITIARLARAAFKRTRYSLRTRRWVVDVLELRGARASGMEGLRTGRAREAPRFARTHVDPHESTGFHGPILWNASRRRDPFADRAAVTFRQRRRIH